MENFSTSVIEKLFGERLDSSRFTWLNHASVCGTSSSDILNVCGWKSKFDIVFSRYKILGWCFGSDLRVRPKLDSLGVMFWDNEQRQEIWCHVSKTLILLFCIRLNIQKQEMFSYI